MALTLPTFPNDRDPANPYAHAYAWMSSLYINFGTGAGTIALTINPNEAAWQAAPVGTISASLEQAHGPDARMPRLDELMADEDFAAAFRLIGTKLYGAMVSAVPAMDGTTPA